MANQLIINSGKVTLEPYRLNPLSSRATSPFSKCTLIFKICFHSQNVLSFPKASSWMHWPSRHCLIVREECSPHLDETYPFLKVWTFLYLKRLKTLEPY